jgi:hypothetical protein
MFSVISIGSPLPDRQNTEPIEVTQDFEITENPIEQIQLKFTATPEFSIDYSSDLEINSATDYKDLSTDFISAKQISLKTPSFILDKEYQLIDKYRYPIYEYEPAIEPPLNIWRS